MKILVIVPSYKPAYIYGGPIESVSKMCEGLARKGHGVEVYTTTANGKEELGLVANKSVRVDGVSVTYFTRITKDHTHISPRLWYQLWTNVKHFDIVHIQSWWSILVIIAALICHFKGAKVIVSPRGMLSEYIFTATNGRSKRILHKYLGRYALSKSFYHATATSEAEECLKLIPEWKGFVLPNILTLPNARKQSNFRPKFNLIFLSRIHPKKGLEILFEAISRIEIDLNLEIAGTGEIEYVNTLKVLARKLDIEDRIKWLGWLDRQDKFNYLEKADLFILVSQNENFANVVIESLHMGTPALVSKNVGLSDFVSESDMGWVTSLDPKDIALNIVKAYEDKEKRDRIRTQGRRIVGSVFSEEKLLSGYEKAYRSIIG